MLTQLLNVSQNQWGEFTIHDTKNRTYGKALSTVFGLPDKHNSASFDDYDDPILENLQILDYRYMRFIFHPLKDQFVMSNSWKDPAWKNVKAIRGGIDGDEKDNRELVFGKNLIDIREKTVPELLLDEVC
jgi:cation-transporting ATPase 13A3/4/5